MSCAVVLVVLIIPSMLYCPRLGEPPLWTVDEISQDGGRRASLFLTRTQRGVDRRMFTRVHVIILVDGWRGRAMLLDGGGGFCGDSV